MSKTTTAKVRAMLAQCMERAVKGDMPVEDGRNIIGFANQISQSMAVELKLLQFKLKAGAGVDEFGALEID